jgi:nicotinamide riboside kinase
MKVVVFTGPESVGKSTLAATMQRTYGGLQCSEYVREFIDVHQRETTFADVTTIAEGQLAREDAARAQAPEWLWLDTHLLSNQLWSDLLFGGCPPWLEPALLGRHYDLHLLLSPEGVNWTADGQRCQPDLDDRRRFFERCRLWLDTHC